jgi:hypothetical protein
VCVGLMGTCLDQIANNYPDMFWRITDNGLNVGRLKAIRIALFKFDEFAGKLTRENAGNRRLSKEALRTIAKGLDEKGFRPINFLQDKQKNILDKHHADFPEKPIGTFQAAIRYPQFARFVRRRLYVARDEFDRANPMSERPEQQV